MAQMYKVFIKESLLILSDKAEDGAKNFLGLEQLRNLVKSLYTEEKREVQVWSNDLAKLWQSFKSIYKIIDAAGGAIQNEEGELLMIYRLGHWDLPKGKIELNESKEEGALREVIEECGVNEPSIVGVLPTTYHYYELKGQGILKRSFWFAMELEKNSPLKPQLEEDISQVIWCSPAKVQELKEQSYGNIRLVLDAMEEEEWW
jgi:8-oxo-dGTP pyrophosphatase MutT (NUDIX family)